MQLLVGGQYTFPHHVNVVFEYFHSGEGLSGAEWSDFRRLGSRAASELSTGNPNLLIQTNSQFTPIGMSRDYVFTRFAWPIRLQKLEAETITITSLRDGSTVVRPGIYWKITPNWTLYWIQTEFIGAPRTEFGHVQIRRSSDIGLRFHF
jgi:hypothetical protein